MILDTLVRLGTITALVGSVWLYHDASKERAHARSIRAHHMSVARDFRERLAVDGAPRHFVWRSFASPVRPGGVGYPTCGGRGG